MGASWTGSSSAGATFPLTNEDAAGDPALELTVTGEAEPSLVVDHDGTLTWDPGTGAGDLTISRNAAGELLINGTGATPAGSVKLGARSDLGRWLNIVGFDGFGDSLIQADGNALKLQGGGTIKFGTTGSPQFLEIPEFGADPAAPGADTARLFVRDNGAGKTQLCVRFPTGAVQVIATEP